MAYFARVNIRMIVDKVISAEQDFIDQLPDSANWVQTSYNTRGGIHYDPVTKEPSADQSKALRKNYAGLGYRYDNVRDAFIPQKLYPSWTLNETTCLWVPPVPKPSLEVVRDYIDWLWNEENQEWYKVG
jgi:hypothetical protein